MNKKIGSTLHILSNAASAETRARISLLQEEVLADASNHIFSWPDSNQFLNPLYGVQKHIARLKPNVVHFWDWNFDVTSILQLAAICRTTRCIVSFRSAPPGRMTFLQKQLIRFVFKHAQNLIVGHNTAAERFRSLGVPERKLNVIVQSSKPFSDVDLSDVTSSIHLPGDATLIGGIADDEPTEQIKDMVWALDLLTYVVPASQLLLFGRPRDPWRIERFIRQVGIQSQVHFLPKQQFSAWLNRLSCFWLVNLTDAESEVFKAMQIGVPTVASHAAINAEWVIPNETGIRVGPGNRADLARKTLWLLDNTEESAELSQNAQAFSENRMRLESMLNGYSQVYQSAV